MELLLNYFVYFILFLKIMFVVSTILDRVLQVKLGFDDDPWLKKIKYMTEYLFIISTSILLIYHFNPYKYRPVNRETGLIFFAFAIISLIDEIKNK